MCSVCMVSVEVCSVCMVSVEVCRVCMVSVAVCSVYIYIYTVHTGVYVWPPVKLPYTPHNLSTILVRHFRSAHTSGYCRQLRGRCATFLSDGSSVDTAACACTSVPRTHARTHIQKHTYTHIQTYSQRTFVSITAYTCWVLSRRNSIRPNTFSH